MVVNQHSQRGMTLLELSIVMAVIALLIVGIMQGSVLVRGAQVRDVVVIAGDLSGAVNAFKERYRVLPGDHPLATTEIPGASNNGNGSGRIDNAEASLFVANHLIRAGFIKGDATQALRSSYGLIWIVQQSQAIAVSPCGAAVNSTAPLPQTMHVILFGNLPGDVAEEVDRKLDDGLFNSGSVRASAAYTNSTVQCLAVPL